MSAQEPEDLSGKTVLLTGASGGIGAATARVLIDRGARVLAHYSSDVDSVQRLVAEVGGERCVPLRADLSRPGSGRALWHAALARGERVDTLVLNAAVMPALPIDGDDRDWDAGWELTMRVNVIEPASLAREAVRHFAVRGGGTLVAMSSWSGQQGSAIPDLSAYAASKAAIRAFAQTIARNHAREGVLAFVVAPGLVRTPLTEVSVAHRGGIDRVNEMLSMGEMVEPEEVGRLVAFLASGSVRHLTGATLDLNGATYVR